jgi:carboxynorspermidine decarboxylase
MTAFAYDTRQLPSPAFVCDLAALDQNLAILSRVQEQAGCKVLLALKGFALWHVGSRVARALKGVSASSVHEARLGREEFGGEVHACGPAFSPADFEQLLGWCDHIVLNSPSQLERLRPLRDAWAARHGRTVELGLRLNPEHREAKVALYDPCAPRSRLGSTAAEIAGMNFEGIEGLHFHTLCQHGVEALERTLEVVQERFASLLRRVSWVNMGGGHHITRPGYDVDRLVQLVREFRARHGVAVYLEPGEAVALGAGVLVASVLDILHNEVDIAVLDVSATAHMPDVLEMPYRPQILGAKEPGATPFTYRLGGASCLAGDVIGDYAFEGPLAIGDQLVFTDMLHYTMVKTTTFNGVRLPSIAVADPSDGSIRVLRDFGYEDYKRRLG